MTRSMVSPPTDTSTPLPTGIAAVPWNAWTSPRSRSAAYTSPPLGTSNAAAYSWVSSKTPYGPVCECA